MSQKAVKVFIIGCLILFSTLDLLAQSDEFLKQWAARQLEKQNANLIDIVDVQLWPQAERPNTFIILGTAQRESQVESPPSRFTFPYVLLAASSRADKLQTPKLTAISIPADSLQGHISAMLSIPGDRMNGPLRIDPGPYPLRLGEYGFGVRYRVSAIGNKGGAAYEVLSLFRQQDSELKEVLRDVLWAYSKYESDANSCNSEMRVSPGKTMVDGFFDYLRQHERSYYGEHRNPEFFGANNLPEIPVPSCLSFKKLEAVNIHRWNLDKAIYLDSKSRLLQWDDLFK